MLKHFGSGPDNDTLLGDLDEQYVEKNSARWYWRQIMGGIVISFFKEIRGHKWIAGRALLTGWMVWFAFVKISPPISLWIAISSFKEVRGLNWVFLFFGNRTVLSFVDALYAPLLVGIVCGWIVAHFHRNHQTAVVLLFAASFILRYLPLAVSEVLTPHLYENFAMVVISAAVGILLGGGLLLNKSNTVAN
jgi:hypothetical protein